MATETVNQEATIDEGSEKTFTQAELDQIVQDRLRREREKFTDYEGKSRTPGSDRRGCKDRASESNGESREAASGVVRYETCR